MTIEPSFSLVANSDGLEPFVDELQVLRAWMQRAAIGLMVVNAQGVIEFANPMAQELCAGMPTELLGQPCTVLFAQPLAPAENLAMQSSLVSAQPWSVQAMIQRMNGTEFLGDFQLIPVADSMSGYTRWCVFLRDISQILHATDQEQHFATLDQLTLLPNRPQFLQNLQQLLGSAGMAGEYVLMAWIDVDHLRSINEAMGHAAADQVLLNIANLMREASRRQDLLARLGGDEFALVMSGGSDIQVLQEAAERLIRGLQAKLVVPESAMKLSLTVGTAIFPADARYVDDLMSCAEMALLEAKKGGRRCHVSLHHRSGARRRPPHSSRCRTAQCHHDG